MVGMNIRETLCSVSSLICEAYIEDKEYKTTFSTTDVFGHMWVT